MKKRKIKFSRILFILLVVFLVVGIVYRLIEFYSHPSTENQTIEEETTEEEVYVDPVYKNEYTFEQFVLEENRMSYEDDKTRSSFGIDISYSQNNINWQQVKDAGVEFVFVRAGYRGYESGLINLDNYFHQHIQNALAMDIPVGVYFFSQAITPEEAIEEARFVLNEVKDYPMALPIVFDMEYVGRRDRIRNLSAYDITQITLAFVQEIKLAGYEPMVYGSASWLQTQLFMEQLQDECEFWVASYNTEKMPYDYVFSYWQYTNKGFIDGIVGTVDLDIRMESKLGN